MKSILFLLVFFSVYFLKAQSFIQKNTNTNSTLVTLKYDENKGGNRPYLEIHFKDGFNLFSWVTPVCEGDYAWCLRNANNEDVAYLKIDIVGNILTSSFKLDPIFYKQPNATNMKKHIDLLKGTFVRSK